MKFTKLQENALLIVWAIALVATMGSLFYSEIMHFEPCKLCWFQRILMYPLVIIFGTAYVKKDFSIALPGYILSMIGAPLALYHYIIQQVDTLSADFCGQVSCTAKYVNYFGFITIPFLSFVAFTLIFLVYTIVIVKNKGADKV
ncbi:disulfide oxidoreductase [Salirhabdus sp. Marseille-P4669]|uniref:disulfide oxidoreductase n=1 Tax=Salirhabdus sp. Marseille-P4669 TaxID=2042310 RepID=UPI000C7DAC23|nr:disulfide oxidoreductase [Salirhabdus sp. Marseille-P4669]